MRNADFGFEKDSSCHYICINLLTIIFSRQYISKKQILMLVNLEDEDRSKRKRVVNE